MVAVCDNPDNVPTIINTTINWIDWLTVRYNMGNHSFQLGYDNLAHIEHRLGGCHRTGQIRLADQLIEPVQDDLLTQAEVVFTPATLRFLTTVG
ncbi:hypothetical protein [Mycobacterium uberis]|uniref:hypothetical protein n=1 Tax=Mycobacterium uberis TaxID=2162698 RepID=UPI003C77DE12